MKNHSARRIAETQRIDETKRIEVSLFQTPTFQALTIGIPFCIFKLLFGVLCMRVGSGAVFGFLVSFGWLEIGRASFRERVSMFV
jgi:hypothetical protein